jgi:hypothetical protein
MYIPIIKTGEAEIKASEKLTPGMLDRITPIIELTRGRQKTTKQGNDKIVTYPFDKRLAKMKEAFKGRTVFFDLTTDENLLSNEVHSLYHFASGYVRWRSFVNDNVGEEGFGRIIPAVLMNWDDDDFETNFGLQVKGLAADCGAVMYRSAIQTKDCYDELPLLLKYLPEGCELWIVLDGGYLQDSAVELAYNRCKKRIQNIKDRILNGRSAKFVVASTSYPERVFDYGEGNPIVISHSEVKLYDRLKTDYSDIVYGDYAGINPIRQDLVVMARGWIPRIDIPLIYKTKVYWKRRPKGTTEYKGTYVNVAEETVSDAEFPTALRGKWGLNEIVKCADGEVTSCAPNFWISVRMFNHIYTQLIRIEKESK